LRGNGVKFNAGDRIAVASCSVYNSTFNIQASRGNNVLQIIWLGTTYTFTFPDGFYDASQINAFIQQQCILNGLYITSNNGATYVYFLEVTTNAVRYAISLNVYPIPTSAQATSLGYSQPSSPTWSFPATASTPQFILTTNFGALVGQYAQTLPATVQSTAQQYVSVITPIIAPVDSYIITCNLINNPYSVPNNILYSLPISVSLGQLISVNPSQFLFNDIDPNTYSQITINFYDQLFNKLQLNDKDIVVTLAIESANESK